MEPTIGRILHYRLREQDIAAIEADRKGYDVKNVGNPHEVGQVVPLLVARVWPNEFGSGRAGVNGQVFVDGNHALWITSAGEGKEPGQWSWPPRVEEKAS